MLDIVYAYSYFSMKEFKSFEALDAALEERDFERVLKGRFDKVVAGDFKCELPPLRSISIIPVKAAVEGGGTRHSFNAVIYYQTPNEREKHVTWSVFEDGVFSGQVPKDLPLSRTEISQEILRTIERIDFDFWHKTELPILPEHDEGEEREAGTPHERREPPCIDPARLQFLEHQPQALFGFVDTHNGFRGYHGAVLPTVIVLEHPRLGNAAFVVPLHERISVSPDVFNRPPSSRMDEGMVQELLARYWSPIARGARTRRELLKNFGAVRVVHQGPETAWQQRLQKAIEEFSRASAA